MIKRPREETLEPEWDQFHCAWVGAVTLAGIWSCRKDTTIAILPRDVLKLICIEVYCNPKPLELFHDDPNFIGVTPYQCKSRVVTSRNVYECSICKRASQDQCEYHPTAKQRKL